MLKKFDFIAQKTRMVFKEFFVVSLMALSLLSQAQAEPLVPQNIVDGHLSGYSDAEKELIQNDLNNIRQLCLNNLQASSQQHRYIATAGGPGSCKSTILEQYLVDKPDFAYIDPDQCALKFMFSYINEFSLLKRSQNKDEQQLSINAYTKWRGASNYIANTLLNEAFEKKLNIAHGSTSTAPQVKFLYESLAKSSYKITLLLCYATDDQRVQSIKHRETQQNFVQSNQDDLVAKGKMFPERFETYFQYADEILLYWTDDFKLGSILAATLSKGKEIDIKDQTAFDKFKSQYSHDLSSDELKSKNLRPLQVLIDEFSK